MEKLDKLIELLNEFEKEKCWGLRDGKLHNTYYGDYDQEDEENRVVSKKYGFIKWLVDNDKIDKEKIKEWNYVNLDKSLFSQVNVILMLLAIQDEPLEFLCNILK